jgi:hypothetical protein
MKGNYCHEKGHWAKECEKEESFANFIETSSFVTNVGYVIATSHGPTHHNNIHDWIVDVGASKHMTNRKYWFSICNFFIINLHIRLPHTFQCGKRNVNVAFHPFVQK